eukprot:TRINITY_DN508_c1_g1_i1.p1 TRINITY_DN508_c1_g1~~TRINITY_DN508_c1_g1_i1.p1  ORF type:complete len:273 (-),score=43.22 TRINITY_DN508_c1_g1_i1:832-1650(-)
MNHNDNHDHHGAARSPRIENHVTIVEDKNWTFKSATAVDFTAPRKKRRNSAPLITISPFLHHFRVDQPYRALPETAGPTMQSAGQNPSQPYRPGQDNPQSAQNVSSHTNHPQYRAPAATGHDSPTNHTNLQHQDGPQPPKSKPKLQNESSDPLKEKINILNKCISTSISNGSSQSNPPNSSPNRSGYTIPKIQMLPSSQSNAMSDIDSYQIESGKKTRFGPRGYGSSAIASGGGGGGGGGGGKYVGMASSSVPYHGPVHAIPDRISPLWAHT